MRAAELDSLLEGLPGGERVKVGLRDLEQGSQSIEAMWLQMASGRLRRNSIEVAPADPEVHLRLHAACVARDPKTGHATYRALNEELSSFLDAVEARRRRAQAG